MRHGPGMDGDRSAMQVRQARARSTGVAAAVRGHDPQRSDPAACFFTAPLWWWLRPSGWGRGAAPPQSRMPRHASMRSRRPRLPPCVRTGWPWRASSTTRSPAPSASSSFRRGPPRCCGCRTPRELDELLPRLSAPDRPAPDFSPHGIEAVPELADRMRCGGVRVATHLEGPVGEVPPPVALTAYRIVQECLGNSARYAPGARVRVAVRALGSAVEVEVADDGPGAATLGRNGFGLVGLAERVRGWVGPSQSARAMPAGASGSPRDCRCPRQLRRRRDPGAAGRRPRAVAQRGGRDHCHRSGPRD